VVWSFVSQGLKQQKN